MFWQEIYEHSICNIWIWTHISLRPFLKTRTWQYSMKCTMYVLEHISLILNILTIFILLWTFFGKFIHKINSSFVKSIQMIQLNHWGLAPLYYVFPKINREFSLISYKDNAPARTRKFFWFEWSNYNYNSTEIPKNVKVGFLELFLFEGFSERRLNIWELLRTLFTCLVVYLVSTGKVIYQTKTPSFSISGIISIVAR